MQLSSEILAQVAATLSAAVIAHDRDSFDPMDTPFDKRQARAVRVFAGLLAELEAKYGNTAE